MYKPQDVKIAPNGLNLLAPGDQVAPGDCLDLTGFWPGAVGRIQQAPGSQNLSAGHLATWFDSICQTSGRTYYGGGGNLHQVGRGGAGEAAIDSGYDGYPLGMIAYGGYQWIMNRSKQRRDNGSAVSDWTPAPPALPSCTNPATTSAAHVVVECDPGEADAGGTFGQIKMWTSSSVAGIELGALITIAGNAEPAMNTTGQVTAIFLGSPNSLIYLKATLAAGTVYGMGGTFTFVNPGMPLGNSSYYITWQYTDLGESNPCSVAGVITPVVVSVTVPGTKVVVSIGALVPPADAVGWNVYRQSVGMASAYRVNPTMIPIATTTYDDFGDAAHTQDNEYLMNALGIIMEGDHDAAPAARIAASLPYNGRLVVANSATYPNRVWYTPALQPGFFRGSGNPQSGDWVDIGTDRGDEILFLAVRPNQIIVYRAKSIWRIRGDFQDPSGRIEVVVPDLGIVGPRAVVLTSLGDYFRSTEGIYKFTGDWAQPVSTKLSPIFRGQSVENFGGEASAYRSNCALGFHAGRLWVSYTWGAGTSNNASFILHVETDRWFSRALGLGAFLDTGSGFIAAGAYYAKSLEDGILDAAAGAPVIAYQSAYEDCGYPDHEKTYADLVVHHNTAGQTLTVRIRTNKNATSADAFDLDTTITSSSLTKQAIPLVYPAAYSVVALRGQPIRAYNLSVRITGTAANASPGIQIDTPLILHWYLEARKGLMFDTDETDHGLPGVTKTVDMVEFDIDSSAGPGTLQIYSDIPGGTMTARLGAGVAIAQTSGRSTVRIVLSPIDGKLLRYVATTSAGFQIYGFRARITPIGVYLDGSVNETWDTRPIPIAA